MSNPIRIATAALSERIFAGRLTKDGLAFKEPRYDVTSDVFVAIRDRVGIGNVIDVGLDGTGVMFRIAVLAPGQEAHPTPSDERSRALEEAAKIAKPDNGGCTERGEYKLRCEIADAIRALISSIPADDGGA